MSYVFVNISHVLFLIEVFVVLLVIKILMFLLFQVTGLVGGHKTRKDKYYDNRSSPSWKSLSALPCFTGAVVQDGFIYLQALSGCYLVRQ